MDKISYQTLYDIEKTHWWFVARRKILHSLIGQFVLSDRGRPTILDVGCSVGVTLNSLKEWGNVNGADFSDEALKFCRRQDSTRITQADACSLPFLGESHDLLVALDLIEHLKDDRSGYLIISVPAYNFLWSDFDIFAHHFKRYGLKELKSRISYEGFEIKKISYINCFLFIGVLLNRLIKKLFKLHMTPRKDLEPPVAAVNNVLEKVFSCEAPLIRKFNFPFGSSILCVAQKKGK